MVRDNKVENLVLKIEFSNIFQIWNFEICIKILSLRLNFRFYKNLFPFPNHNLLDGLFNLLFQSNLSHWCPLQTANQKYSKFLLWDLNQFENIFTWSRAHPEVHQKSRARYKLPLCSTSVKSSHLENLWNFWASCSPPPHFWKLTPMSTNKTTLGALF